MVEETAIGYGVSGWRARQENSRLKRHSKSAEERARIREIRRLHKMEIVAAQEPEEPAGAADATDSTENAPVQAHTAPDEAPRAGASVEIRPSGGGWFEVYVDGELKTEKKVRKAQAEKIAREYRNA